jgi:DNA-binding NtrC family response regulator
VPASLLPGGGFRIVLYDEAGVHTRGSPLLGPQPRRQAGSLLRSHPTAPEQAAASSHRRALVIDDEPTIRSALVRYLRRRGWQADEAEDGKVALRKLGRAAPGGYEVVISDIRMPHYSGVELHDWLAEHRPDLFATLIITTGDLTSPALSEFVARTPRPLIEKPFELSVLAQLIEAVVRGR